MSLNGKAIWMVMFLGDDGWNLLGMKLEDGHSMGVISDKEKDLEEFREIATDFTKQNGRPARLVKWGSCEVLEEFGTKQVH